MPLEGFAEPLDKHNNQSGKEVRIRAYIIESNKSGGVVEVHTAVAPRAAIGACFKHGLLNREVLRRKIEVIRE